MEFLSTLSGVLRRLQRPAAAQTRRVAHAAPSPLLLCAAVMIPIAYLVRFTLSLVIGIPFGLLDSDSARDFIAWLNASTATLVLCYASLWVLLIARVRRS